MLALHPLLVGKGNPDGGNLGLRAAKARSEARQRLLAPRIGGEFELAGGGIDMSPFPRPRQPYV